MSWEDEELVRRHFDFWNERHDPGALAEAFWHEEVEWIEPPDSLDAAVYRGRSAAVGYLAQWMEHMGETPAIVEEVLRSDEEGMDGGHSAEPMGSQPCACLCASRTPQSGQIVISPPVPSRVTTLTAPRSLPCG